MNHKTMHPTHFMGERIEKIDHHAPRQEVVIRTVNRRHSMSSKEFQRILEQSAPSMENPFTLSANTEPSEYEMLEKKVKEKVKVILTEFGAYSFMPVQNGMGSPGLDFHCCINGHAFAIETKAPGKKPTPRQVNTMDQMENAGMKCFVIDDSDYLELQAWLAKHSA